MRRLKFLIGMSCLVFAGAATQSIAAPITHNVTFGAVVQGSCSLTGTASAVSGAFSAVSQAGSTFTVGVTGSTANPTTGELALGTITCNSASMKVTLTPDGWIRRTGGGEITYSAYVKNGATDLNNGNPFISSAGGTGPKVVNVALTSIALNLVIQTNQATGLTAGNYAGALAVSIDAI